MSISLVPPLPGGSGAFTLASWICCGCNTGLTSDGCQFSSVDGHEGDRRLPPTSCARVQDSCVKGNEPQSGGDRPAVARKYHGGYEVESAHI
jgi:hypothetical protein